MANQLTRTQIGQGTHFNTVVDSKFKHNRLAVHFIMPLERQSASDNAAVPFILRKGFRECPDFTSLNARLAELYGAALDADVSKFGGWQDLEISIRGLDNRFALEHEDITGMCAQLLASVALDPKLDGQGLFDPQDVALERQYVLDSIEAEINDKRSYALARCMQVMCADEPVAVRRYGEIETAKAITPASATQAYRRMLREAQVEIVFVGSGDSGKAAQIFTQAFGKVDRAPAPLPPLSLRTTANRQRETTETMELSQSKMVLGMRTGKAASVQEVNARRVFSALFGGTPFSKLFLNVREKLSLCYYCSSAYDFSTGLLLVQSGVEAENKQKAQDEILKQLKAVQDGDFDDAHLHNTKLLMKNSVTAVGDSPAGLGDWYLSQILRGQSLSPQEDIANIDQITKEDVVSAANAVTLDTIYFLTGNATGEGE